MNEQQEFIERLKSIVKESQIYIPNYNVNEYPLITEIRLIDFPYWLVGPTYDRFFTIFFRQGKPSHIEVEVVVGVDPFRLELDPRNQDKSPGLPLGYIAQDLFTDHKVAHYYLSVNAATQPMQVREDPAPYGDDRK